MQLRKHQLASATEARFTGIQARGRPAGPELESIAVRFRSCPPYPRGSWGALWVSSWVSQQAAGAGWRAQPQSERGEENDRSTSSGRAEAGKATLPCSHPGSKFLPTRFQPAIAAQTRSRFLVPCPDDVRNLCVGIRVRQVLQGSVLCTDRLQCSGQTSRIIGMLTTTTSTSSGSPIRQ
jgi:hypothetical protein